MVVSKPRRSDVPSLRTALLLTRAGMLAERVTRSFWPFWSWLFVVWTALAFGLIGYLPSIAAYGVIGIAAIGAAALLFTGIRGFYWPSWAQAIDRLDRSMKDRPLSALVDTLAVGAGDAGASGVWRAHLARMAAQAAKARPVWPDLRISARDPYGLRYIAATSLGVALMFGSVSREGGLGEILLPGGGSAAVAAGPAFEGWVEPPRYTRLPVIYLNGVRGSDPLPVPEGSKVTLRLYPQTGGLKVIETISGRDKKDRQPGATAQEFVVKRSGILRIAGAGNEARWQIKMIPDTPPMIAMSSPITRGPNGETKLGFEAVDDYGVVAATATLRLDLFAVDRRYGLALAPEPRPEITLDIPLPFNRDKTKFNDTFVKDLSRHPWAGLPVTLSLSAVDALGQKASAEPELIKLPARRFFDPLAATIIEQRRDLLWNRKNARRVAQVLRAISNHPEDIFGNPSAYLILQSAIRQIKLNLDPVLSGEARDAVANLLWKTALLIEDGKLSDAAARLRRAQDRLSEALKDGASRNEIAKLIRELRRAMQDYMRQLAQKSDRPKDQAQNQNGQTREITDRQLQRLLDRIEALAKQGRVKEAQQLLRQLRRMMQNMQTARRQQGEGPGRKSMRNLQGLLRQQQDLSDEAFRKLQEQFNGQQQAPGAGDLAQQQEELRRLLGAARDRLPAAGTDAGRAARKALRRAEQQMGQAREALDQGDLPKALDDQADALQSLRDGLDGLGKELARNQSRQNGRQGNRAGSQNLGSRDPLGRENGAMGRVGPKGDLLRGDSRNPRARQLLDEIRRRSEDRSRPRFELDYLNRLLNRF